MKDTKIIRDPIHGFVELPSDLFDSLVDTVMFQRLREIKQLGLAHYVYPGAVHTRFEHSLGAAHVMSNMIDSIINNTDRYVLPFLSSEDIKKHLQAVLEELQKLKAEAVTAALLHDVGHIALSHTSEKLNEDYLDFVTLIKDKEIKKYFKTTQKHEEVTIMIIKKIIAEGKKVLFNGREVELSIVEKILTHAYKGNVPLKTPKDNAIEVISELISSEIDVDRGDYILRDSYFSGTSTKLYDLERLYKVIVLVPKNLRPPWAGVGVLEKGVSIIENMLLSRIYMYKDVYLHPVSMIYSAMAARFLNLVVVASVKYEKVNAIEQVEWLKMILFGDVAEFEENVVSLTDSAFYSLLKKIKYMDFGDEECDELIMSMKALAEGLLSRRHWSALVMDESSASKLVEKIEEQHVYFKDKAKEYLTPSSIFFKSKYDAYAGNVLVFDRKTPHVPQKLHESPLSVIASKIKDVRYAKVIIVAPKLDSVKGLTKWRLKRGRFDWSHPKCVEKFGKMVQESERKAIEFAKELESWIP